jgi:hypothetical protein
VQIDPRTLEGLPRDQLIDRARKAGVRRPELLTRVELKDEIVRLSETDERKRRAARGWFGVARDLLASVVEQGLHMPDAAKLIRGEPLLGENYKAQAPVATVTLAEIYVAQGHTQRALAILDEVLTREPDHEAARGLRDRLSAEAEREGAAQSERPAKVAGSSAAPAGAKPAKSAKPAAEAKPADPPSAPAAKPAAEAKPADPPSAPAAKPAAEAKPASPTQHAKRVGEAKPAAEAKPRAAARAADVVVTIAEAPGSVYLYWEVSERALRRAQKLQADGHAVIRLLEVRPSWDGAERVERELDVELPSGSRRVPTDETALVRAALGWRSSAGFLPFAVGSELSPPAGNGAEPGLSPSQRRALEKYRTVAK